MARGTSFAATGQVVAAAAVGQGQQIVGVSALDTSASANVITVYDGTDATGKVIASIDLVASKSGGVDFNFPRVATAGVYVACTGACKGTVWIA